MVVYGNNEIQPYDIPKEDISRVDIPGAFDRRKVRRTGDAGHQPCDYFLCW